MNFCINKSIIIIIVIFLNLSNSKSNEKNCLYSSAFNTENSLKDNLTFYPLTIGNKWIYLNYGESEGWDYYKYILHYEVIGDTSMPNNKSYCIIRKLICSDNWIDEEYVYERIDTLTGKVFSYDNYYQDEWLSEDLTIAVNDTFPGSHYCFSPSCYTYLIRKDSIELFGSIYDSKIYQSFDLSEHNYTLASNFGLVLDNYTFDFGWGTMELKGSIIAGELFGDTAIVSIVHEGISQENIQIYQNYPNPFNPYTTIKYTLSEPSHVQLIVYNVLGEKIQTLIDKEQNRGNYSITFNANNLPSGIYFCRLIAGSFKKTIKLMLIE